VADLVEPALPLRDWILMRFVEWDWIGQSGPETYDRLADRLYVDPPRSFAIRRDAGIRCAWSGTSENDGKEPQLRPRPAIATPEAGSVRSLHELPR
jgi:hypothetical protein